jgi:hypothetical protein
MASAVEIALNDEECLELERRAAKLTLPYRDVQRARSCCTPPWVCLTPRSPLGLGCARRLSGSGGDDFANSALPVCRTNRGRVGRGAFPPEEVAQVKAIACELPGTHGLPLIANI